MSIIQETNTFNPLFEHIPPPYIENPFEIEPIPPYILETYDYPISRETERGYCLIINIQHFRYNSEMTRHGSNFDCDKLKSTFKNLRYKVVICNDPTLNDIQSELNKLSARMCEHHDSVVVCLLSHGEQDCNIITADGEKLNYRDCILEALGPTNCPAMKLKPKIVIVQACRGEKKDLGVNTDGGSSEQTVVDRKLTPTQSDFLFCYSTVEGYRAFRYPKKGSPFIQTLCDRIDELHYEKDIVHILTIVNANMSESTMSNGGTRYAATCEFVSRLTKRFRFG